MTHLTQQMLAEIHQRILDAGISDHVEHCLLEVFRPDRLTPESATKPGTAARAAEVLSAAAAQRPIREVVVAGETRGRNGSTGFTHWTRAPAGHRWCKAGENGMGANPKRREDPIFWLGGDLFIGFWPGEGDDPKANRANWHMFTVTDDGVWKSNDGWMWLEDY